MSLLDCYLDVNGCSSTSNNMRVDNQRKVEGDQREQGEIQPLFEAISESPSCFYLPRSSPVISRGQKEKMPVIAANNKGFHEHTEESLQRGRAAWVELSSVSKPLDCVSPEEQTVSTSSASQALPLDEHSVPTAVKYAKDFDKHRSGTESQSPSCEGTGTLALENGTLTQLTKSLFFGAEHEEQISEAFYKNSIDLDQENAHFVVVDMVLEVLEAAKWDVSQKHSASFSSTDSGYEELFYNRHSFKSSSQAFRRCSAEFLAQSLLMELERWWTFSDELLGECPLVTVTMAKGDYASLSNEIREKSRMRGTLIWTPPQFQIISSVNLTQRRSEIVASQQFLCAGCGTTIEPRYMKRLRYCDYLGKYFCDGCHSGAESVIPARVLSHWDFGLYPVCHFSKQLLEFIWEKPLFRISDITTNLYSQAKELQMFRVIQEQLISIKKLLGACRLSEGVLLKFQHLPSHLTEELHLFSMDDLIKIKRSQYRTTAKTVMLSATNHVEACELCQAKGFICEFCHGKDVLFPFQTDICTRCRECRACFHTTCFRDEACPKCSRLQIRRATMTSK